MSVESDGFTVMSGVVSDEALTQVRSGCDCARAGDAVRTRRGRTFAIRNALSVLPEARKLATLRSITDLAAAYLPGKPQITRAILFDKNSDANWTVAWHQDVTIAVPERCNMPGFGPWSVKAGVVHVQPPAAILERMITLRIALDDCDTANGPLLVLPGTHNRGFLNETTIEALRTGTSAVASTCASGDVVVMRPLLLHASAPASLPRRRRVLHLEFAGEDLPGELEWNSA